MNDTWLALPRAAGDRAGVFEHDGRVGYFYLYDSNGAPGRKVLGAVRVIGADPALRNGDVGLLWSGDERFVGVMIRGRLCAAFDCGTGEVFGGVCQPDGSPSKIPEQVRASFGL